MLTTVTGEYPKRAPIGVYDQTILCEGCERLFGDVDAYALHILKPDPVGAIRHTHQGTLIGLEVPVYRYDLLKLFFISLLWRASVSTHPFYKRINLRRFESIALQMFIDRNPGADEEFGVFLSRWRGSFDNVMLDPHTERQDGLNYCRFYLGHYVAHIKTDKRASRFPFSGLILRRDQPLRIVVRDVQQNRGEMRVLHKILFAPQNRESRARRR